MSSRTLSLELTAKGNLSNELTDARKKMRDLEKQISDIQRTGGTVGDKLAGEYRQATREVDRLGREVKRTNDRIKEMSSSGSKSVASLDKALKSAAIAAAGFMSARMVGDFMGGAIEKASALNESLSKSSVVFGANAKQVQAWSDRASNSFGMTQQAALEAAGTYGNLFQAFGIGRDAATDMSTSLVELAADLASFNNTSMEDALLALRSGLSGETEPLKRYGIALTDLRLKQEAMSRGIYGGVGVLNAAQKAQAAYYLAVKDSSLAQGDFGRTSDGYANGMRRIRAAADEVQTALGVGFLDTLMGGQAGGENIDKTVAQLQSMEASMKSIGETMANVAQGALFAWDVVRGSVTIAAYAVMQTFNEIYDRWIDIQDALGVMSDEEADRERAMQKSIKAAQEQAYYEDLLGYKFGESAQAAHDAASANAAVAASAESAAAAVEDAAAKVDQVTAAVRRMNGLMNQGQALKDFGQAAKDFAGKRNADTAEAFIGSWNTAYATFKKGGKRQAAFVVENYGEMKSAIRNSGIRKSIREQMVDELDAAYLAAKRVKDMLTAIDGTQVSIGVSGIPTLSQYVPMGQQKGEQKRGKAATGGAIFGPGTGTSDSIPMMLSNGEYVIRAAAAKQIGYRNLDRLNRADKMTDPGLLDRVQVSGSGPLIGSLTVTNPARDVDVELAATRAVLRAERIRRERG